MLFKNFSEEVYFRLKKYIFGPKRSIIVCKNVININLCTKYYIDAKSMKVQFKNYYMQENSKKKQEKYQNFGKN